MQGEVGPEQSSDYTIPPEVNKFIDSEAKVSYEETFLAYQEQGFDGRTSKAIAKLQEQSIRDLRTGEYFVLLWLDEQYRPETVLYPGSGGDRIPDFVFGSRVAYLSLEEYAEEDESGEKIGKRHFEELEGVVRRLADVEALPLPNSSVDVIILLESSFVDEPDYVGEFVRVLKNDGVMVLSRDFTFHEEESEEEREAERESKRNELANLSPSLILERVPQEVDFQGGNIKVEYYLLRKK